MSFEKIKDEILGKDYSLSLACVSPAKSREINKKYRKKDKPTNLLSFALSKNSGELVLCKPLIRQEAKKLGKNFAEYLGYLVIHGLLHLKGMRHSSKMERLEEKYGRKYFHWNRRGLNHDQGGSGRIPKRAKRGRKKS